MTYQRLLVLASAASLVGACTSAIGTGDDQGDGPRSEREQSINEYIRGLDRWVVEPPDIVEGETFPPEPSGDYVCTTTNYSETREYDNIVAYAANSASMWPGALLRGDSVDTGLFTPVALPRQPMSFSVSLPTLAGERSATLENPMLSTYREALANILEDEVDGATPANVYAEIEEVHSEDQLAIALGIKANWFLGSVAASFDFEDTQRRSRYLVKFTQTYFTADIDPPELPSDFLGKGVAAEDLQDHWWQGNVPVYVSSVTYGRSVLFMFESDYSLKEMKAALDFAYKAGVSISGSTSVTYREMLDQTHMTAYVLGGSGEDAVKAIDSYEALRAFIEEGGNFSKDSPGAPIAYKLSYLADNSPARFSTTDDYEVKDCYRVTQKLAVTLESIRVVNAGGTERKELELYGSISATGDDTINLFERGSGSYVQINEGSTWPGSGNIAEGILTVSPEPGQAIQLDVNFREYDGVRKDAYYNGSLTIPFELGWRRSAVVHIGGEVDVDVSFRLQPI